MLMMMHKTEKKYEVGKVRDEEEAKQRQFRAILNKLTPQNFTKLFNQALAIDIDNAKTLRGVVEQIFDRALMEPTFCEVYVNFCCHLYGKYPDFSEDNKKISFRRLLLNKCQEEFERRERDREEANKADEAKLSGEEKEEKRVKARRRMLGNIRFIGELYKKKMLVEKIMHRCIQELLGGHQTPNEEDVEALCVLLCTTGEIIDHPISKRNMDMYFDHIESLSNNMELTSRIRFMLKDTIDLRNNKWQQRRKVEGPNKIQDMDRCVAQYRQMQASRLGRGRGRISRGPISRGMLRPDRFSGQAAYDESSAQERSIDYGGRDLRNSDTFDRFVPKSPPARGRASIYPHNTPTEKIWPEELLQEKSRAAIKEFYSARGEEEVTLCIKELNSPSFLPTMISIWVTDSFEGKDRERDLLAKLLVNLTKFHGDTLSQSQLIKGFESVLTTLEDTIIDTPKAPEYLGRILAKTITGNVASLREIGWLIHNGGEKPGSLLNTGLAADVLGNILEVIRSEKGENVTDEIITSSNLHLETFRPPYLRNSRILEKFIRGPPMSYCSIGSGMFSSLYSQLDGFHILPAQVRGFGNHDVRLDAKQPFEARNLTVSLTQRHDGDDAILCKGMSSTSLANISPSSGDSKRVAAVLNDYSSTSDRSYSPRQDLTPRFVPEHLREKSMAAIKEFYSARDEKEVALCIKELNSPSFHPTVISIWVTDSFEGKDIERDLLATLLVNLTKFHGDILIQSQLIKGFESVLTTLEDTIIDSPKAPEYLSRILAKIITENVASLREIGQLIHDGGEEPGSLLNAGLAADVLGNILEIIRSEKGEFVFDEIITSSNLSLETFRPPYPQNSRMLEKFI